jgi:hypothetical protein
MTKVFQTFKRGGKTFIAIPNGSEVSILSEDGENYGSWWNIESFDKHYPTGADYDATPLGKASLGLHYP